DYLGQAGKEASVSYMLVMDFSDCFDGGGGSGGGGGGGSTGGSPGGNPGGGNPGGGGGLPGGGVGSDPKPTRPIHPIKTTPIKYIPTGQMNVSLFLFNLQYGGNADLYQWWQDNAETEEWQGIYDYVYDGGDKSFAKWSIDFFIENPGITWEQFENWFMGEVNFVETNLNINPENISYEVPLTQQPLPTFSNFISHFPKQVNNGNYFEMPAHQVYNLVGGSLLNSYNNNPASYSNACSIRGSRALLYSGITIPVLNYGSGQRTQKGGDNLNYILDAVSFNKFMIDKFGDTPHKLEG